MEQFSTSLAMRQMLDKSTKRYPYKSEWLKLKIVTTLNASDMWINQITPMLLIGM